MQTILGANGNIANELAKVLPHYTSQIRLVSRHPKPVNPTDQVLAADLLDPQQTDAAVQGSEVVYLTAGLVYNHKVWQAQWPVLMRNVLDACARHGAKLVFFDNVYMYGRVAGPMTEDTPVRPVSRKGQVRAQVAQMLLDDVAQGRVTALIARSADFYGKSPLSVPSVMLFDKLAQGKAGQWMVSDRFRHSYTYIPDAGRATALLGNTPSAYNQVWHLPTDPQHLTGREFIGLAAQAFGVPPKYQVLPRWMLQMVGWFVPVVGQSIEMLYQNDTDYIFDSSKFARHFDLRPTPYAQGLAEVARLYGRGS
jgi:nucleoside-diphosphate-sugar epimerase